MISGWFLKTALGLALLGLVIFEAASPQVVRVQIDGTASTAAHESMLEFERGKNAEAAKAVADTEAAKGSAAVEKFEVGPDGAVRLTLYRRAKSFVAYRWSKLHGYYDVRASAESSRE